MTSVPAFEWEGGEPLAIAPGTFLKGRSSWTGGSYCVTAGTLQPRALVPPHAHAEDVQVTIVIDGTVGTWVDGAVEIVGAGGYALRPAGLPHCLFNPADVPARFMELTSPGDRFEAYMLALSELKAAGEPAPEEVRRLAMTAGITFVDDPLAELRERYSLTP